MSVANNKDIIQSYILTNSRYSFTAAEKRVMYQIVNILQQHVEGKKLEGQYSVTKDMFDYRRITMPISACLKHGESTNYKEVKKALEGLHNKTIEYKDDKRWELFNIVTSPVIEPYTGFMQFDLHWRMYEAFLMFTKGYRQFELLKVMQFDSAYSMRFYEYMSGQDTPIDFTIETLRHRLKLEDKYTQNRDFIKYTVDVAKKELDAKSPYTFDYEVIKKGRKMHKIRFYPKYQPEHRDEEVEARKLQGKTSLHWDLTPIELHYLENQYGFDTTGIKNNRSLFLECKKKGLSLVDEFQEILPKARTANNPQGYLVKTLQRKINWKGINEKV